MLKNWDPLETTLTQEVFGATIKRQIKNILKSYTGWYDPFSELIQNSLDAVDHRKQREPDYSPIISIKIDLKENTISVTDNGIGFSEDQFKSFLAPNVSFKKQGDRGNKGVGATYLGYGFNFLQVGTKTPDFNFIGTIKDDREWVEDESGTKTRPKIQESQIIHDAFDKIDRGSTFTLKFIGEFIRPKDLAWVGANTADQWEMVLKIRTPLGGIYLTRDRLLSECKLTVIDYSGNLTEKNIADIEYIYPHKVINPSINLNEIKDYQQVLIDKGQDPSKLPAKFFKLNGLYNFWKFEDFTEAKREFSDILNQQEKELAKKHKLAIYGYFCYSTDVWDSFNDDIVKLRKGARILKGGLQLSTNGMPQGDLLIIPLTRNIGYQNVAYIVIHFDEAEPDLGRKGFQPELQELAANISVAIVKKFLNWRTFLKKETGGHPDIAAAKAIHDWIREQEDHERDYPMVINRQDIFLPVKEPSITSTPLNEQDVIALFNQLLAGGVIRGIKVMATSQHQQYDGIYRFVLKQPLEIHIFDINKNPLGINIDATKEHTSPPRILEYKYSFDALIEEFEKEEKIEKQIGLVIAWEIGANWHKRYEITPLLHLDNLQH